MKTSKTSAKKQARMQNNLSLANSNGKTITLSELEDLCDDPSRNESGQEVQAVLTPHKYGYAVAARDGASRFDIVDDRGYPLTFLTFEIALEALSDVPYLFPEIRVDMNHWGQVH